MFKKTHIKNILQSELDNEAVHLLFAHDNKKNTSNYTCSMYIFETIVHHKIVSRYSPCNTKKDIL